MERCVPVCPPSAPCPDPSETVEGLWVPAGFCEGTWEQPGAAGPGPVVVVREPGGGVGVTGGGAPHSSRPETRGSGFSGVVGQIPWWGWLILGGALAWLLVRGD